jgi:hypothetical protein
LRGKNREIFVKTGRTNQQILIDASIKEGFEEETKGSRRQGRY